jgi:type II secretory pathway pseudopilin PulG
VNLKKGVSLIEALIAISVVGLVFVALAALQVSSLRVTREAQVDSELLAAAVTSFEEVRTTVLSSFPDYYAACAGGANCWDGDGSVVLQRATALVPAEDPDDPPTVVDVRGLLELQVTARNRRGESLFFKQYVSCLDADEVPTISDPQVCDGTAP